MLKRHKIQMEIEVNNLEFQKEEDTLRYIINKLDDTIFDSLRIVTIKIIDKDLCPNCKTMLNYYEDCRCSVEYYYCPVCQDKMYDVETKEYIGRLE